jgi:hypothetical protein
MFPRAAVDEVGGPDVLDDVSHCFVDGDLVVRAGQAGRPARSSELGFGGAV